jgi:drug/metabolite transporter (DMT)-like permease
MRMLFFIGSIVFSSYLTLSFKVLERYHIPVLPTIVFNYWVCVITGSFVNGDFPINGENMVTPWFKWALAIGCLFIILFNIIAWTTQKIGVAVASVSNKLSLIIPAIFFIITKNDSTAFWKMAGIALALLAVIFTCYPDNGKNKDGKRNHLLYLVPLVLFMGSGILDTLYKYVEETYLDASNLNAYLITGFATAGTIGAIVLLMRYATGKERWNPKTLLAGILIGVPNYFSIWCLGIK